MVREAFSSGNSVIHRLDPRAKIVIALVFSVLVAVATRFQALLPALFLSLLLVATARLQAGAVLRRLLLANSFILLLWLVLPFTYPGEPVFNMGPLAASREGLLYALQITVKSNAIILCCMALLSTSSIVQIGHALWHLRVPDKLVHLLVFGARYFYVIHQEYLRLINAMKVRCFRPRTNVHTYRSYGYLVGMLLLGSYERSERIHAAMRCRGFKGKFYLLHHFALSGADLGFLGLMIPVLAVLGWLQWTQTIL